MEVGMAYKRGGLGERHARPTRRKWATFEDLISRIIRSRNLAEEEKRLYAQAPSVEGGNHG